MPTDQFPDPPTNDSQLSPTVEIIASAEFERRLKAPKSDQENINAKTIVEIIELASKI
jgi:hypothetical protein